MADDTTIPASAAEVPESASTDFIRAAVAEDVRTGRYAGKVRTRFPPEPNAYLHIGHVKAIALDFGVAAEFGGQCNLRFDDTNPAKEEAEYVEQIREDIRWLGFDWGDREYNASDYFGKLFEHAVELVRKGKAYVCDLSQEEVRAHRGTLTEPGRNSPCRDRSVEENLELLGKMRAGELAEGACTLRARIDMASPNITMRDPVMYRIMKIPHHRTGDAWCIYPMYDFAHPLSDAFEEITHSLCSLEYEIHRPLYDWFIRECGVYPSRQIEFARFNLTHTVMSKRKFVTLVQGGHVRGFDDPRLPTIAGMRRRGYTPQAILAFIRSVGMAKTPSTVEVALLEHFIREDLNKTAPRRMAVLRPLKLIVDNYPEGQVEELDAENNPEDPTAGTRKMPFSRELYIEREDFMENPPKKFHRLSPGKEIRLKHAYYVTCTRVVKDPASNEVAELHCTYDPASRGGWTQDGRVVRGTSHWVSAAHALSAEVRILEHLFTKENPDDAPEGQDYRANLNPRSQETLTGCMVEHTLSTARPGDRFQFLRQGYFCADPDSAERLVFNRTVGLVDSWAKIQAKELGEGGGRRGRGRAPADAGKEETE
jgi:glutaminyl-tRNA synthetase